MYFKYTDSGRMVWFKEFGIGEHTWRIELWNYPLWHISGFLWCLGYIEIVKSI